MADTHWTITNLLYRYAECIDAGDFEGVGDILAHATLTAEGTALHLDTRAAVLAHYVNVTRRYPDGTPRTKHVTTNPIVEVDEAAGTATCRSYFTVLQAVDGSLALQPIIAGRYHDSFER
ncbi:MAG TPA: nuclear transport factor 2 family protein, partial [Ilumatobacteraceae bacterium]|nr:nuclear transport factor 2 family protein [Ilumatobacteraceae bacterium]